MYKEYFRLKELPFSIAPDPRYLYMSEQHREALAHLVYGINSDGCFVLLTGEVGTGKTTVSRCLLEKIPENTDLAFILNPKLSAGELLATICDELGVQYPEGASGKVFVDMINDYLLDANARGRKTILIMEEAQNLSPDVLEQVRLLTNLETNQRKLLQMIMIGQPELREILSRPELRQLAQRITARFHLGPLSEKEVAAYVAHRLLVAGTHSALFPPSTIKKLYRLSNGIPRLINLLCDRALLGAYVEGLEKVNRSTLFKAAREVLGEADHYMRPAKRLKWLLAGLMFVGCVVAPAVIYYNYQGQPKTVIAPEPVHQAIIARPKIEGPLLSRLVWPADQPIDQSKEMALESLLKQWGVIYKPDNGDACQQVQAQGLSCLEAQGSLSDLLNLNRPAVLKIADNQGSEFYGTLTAIQDQTATIQLGTALRTVDVKEIEQRWSGGYTILWRMPPGYKSPLRPGEKSKMVQWLDKTLSLTQGRSLKAREKRIYDDTLVREVKIFQLDKGLVPNGVVGPETIIHLNAELSKAEPLLINRKEEN